jgi:serine/threonine-protein kinase
MFYSPNQQIIAEIITAAGIPFKDNTTTTTTSFLTYENPTYRIRMQYPSNWERIEFDQGINYNVVVIFRSPPENASDTKLENLVIQVANLPFQNISLEELHNANLDNLRNSLTDFELIESVATTIAYSPAHKIVFTNREDDHDRHKTIQVLTIKEDKSYLITYAAEAAKYDHYLSTIQNMIDSFRIGVRVGESGEII